jgi:hypothetical protein
MSSSIVVLAGVIENYDSLSLEFDLWAPLFYVQCTSEISALLGRELFWLVRAHVTQAAAALSAPVEN